MKCSGRMNEESRIMNGVRDKVKWKVWSLCVFPLCAQPMRLIICDLTSRADSWVTLACGGRAWLLVCPVSFWTHWLKPLTSDIRFSFCPSFYLLISNSAPFPLPSSSLHSLNFVLLLSHTTAYNPVLLFFKHSPSCPLQTIFFPFILLHLLFFPVKTSLFMLFCITFPFSYGLSRTPSPPLVLLFFPNS